METSMRNPANRGTVITVTIILAVIIGQSAADVAPFSPECTDTAATVTESPEFSVTFCRLTEGQCAELCAGRDFAFYFFVGTSCSCSNKSSGLNFQPGEGPTSSVNSSEGCEEVYVGRQYFVQALYRTALGRLTCDAEGIGICRGNMIHGASGHLHPDMVAALSGALNQLSPFVPDTASSFYLLEPSITIKFNHSVLIRYLDMWRPDDTSYVASVQIAYTNVNPTVQYYTSTMDFSYSSTPYDGGTPEPMNVTYNASNYARVPLRRFVAQSVTISVVNYIGSPSAKLELIGCRYDETYEGERVPHTPRGCYLFSAAQLTEQPAVSGASESAVLVPGKHVFTDAVRIHEEHYIAPKIKSLPLGRLPSEESCRSVTPTTCLSQEQLILWSGSAISCSEDKVRDTLASNYSAVRDNLGLYGNTSACEQAALVSFEVMRRIIENSHHSKCPNKTRDLYRELVDYHQQSYHLCVLALCSAANTTTASDSNSTTTDTTTTTGATNTTDTTTTDTPSTPPTTTTTAVECEVPPLTKPPKEETTRCVPGPPMTVYRLRLRRPLLDEPLCDPTSNIARIRQLYPGTTETISDTLPPQGPGRAVGQETRVRCGCPYITSLNSSNSEPLVCTPDFTYYSDTFHGCVVRNCSSSVPTEAPEGGTRQWDNNDDVGARMNFTCPDDQFFETSAYPATVWSSCECGEQRWTYEETNRPLPPCVRMCRAENTSATTHLTLVQTTTPPSQYGSPPASHRLQDTEVSFRCTEEESVNFTAVCLPYGNWSIDITNLSLCDVATTTEVTTTTQVTTTTPGTTTTAPFTTTTAPITTTLVAKTTESTTPTTMEITTTSIETTTTDTETTTITAKTTTTTTAAPTEGTTPPTTTTALETTTTSQGTTPSSETTSERYYILLTGKYQCLVS